MSNDPFNLLRITGPTAELLRFKEAAREAGRRNTASGYAEVFDFPGVVGDDPAARYVGDAYSTKLVEEERNSILYTFFSVSNPPCNSIRETSQGFPTLTFLHEYCEDGLGYRGRDVTRAGQLLDHDEGPYGPDGDEFYDQLRPLRDIFTQHFVDFYLAVCDRAAPARCGVCAEEFLTTIGGARPYVRTNDAPVCDGCLACAEADVRVVRLRLADLDARLPEEMLALPAAATEVNDSLAVLTDLYSRANADALREIASRHAAVFAVEDDRPARWIDVRDALATAPTLNNFDFTDERSMLTHVAPGYDFWRACAPPPVRVKPPLDYELKFLKPEGTRPYCCFCGAYFSPAEGTRPFRKGTDEASCPECGKLAEADVRAFEVHVLCGDPRDHEHLKHIALVLTTPHDEGVGDNTPAGEKLVWRSLVSPEHARQLHLLAERHPKDVRIERDFPALAPDLRRALELSRRSRQPYADAEALIAAVAPKREISYAQA